jgi:hypothetical protein
MKLTICSRIVFGDSSQTSHNDSFGRAEQAALDVLKSEVEFLSCEDFDRVWVIFFL